MVPAFAWLLNFDAEDELAAAGASRAAYTPSRAVLARFTSLTAAVEALRGPDDQVILPSPRVPRAPRSGAPASLPAGALAGRAWCPTPRALRALADAGARVPPAPPLDVLRRVNHRRFAAALGQTLPGARFVEDMPALLETIAAPSPTGHWLLKRPFGFAGRGRLRVRSGHLEEAARPWVLASLDPRRRGGDRESRAAGLPIGLQVEPWVERTQDAALHGFVAASGQTTLGEPTVQSTDPSGAWRGSARATTEDLSDGERNALIDAAHEAARALHEAGYFGPFGIDAFRWIDAQGAARWNPRCEINARYSMGWATGMGHERPDRDAG